MVRPSGEVHSRIGLRHSLGSVGPTHVNAAAVDRVRAGGVCPIQASLFDTMGPKQPNEIDRLVGSRVRQRRMQLGMSQDELAAQLGITVPQVQKYEKGVNRIGASRLHKIAGLLGAPIGALFEAHAGDQARELESGGAEAGAAEPSRPDPSVFAGRETVALALAFSRITRPQLRRALIALARAPASIETGALD